MPAAVSVCGRPCAAVRCVPGYGSVRVGKPGRRRYARRVPRFVIERRTELPPAEVWRRLTAWEDHSATVPLTRITVLTPPPSGVGTVFVARTGLGRASFDDPMRVAAWQPPTADGDPGRCWLVKTGRVITGWAEIEVRADGEGSSVRWEEELRVRLLPSAFGGVTQYAGRLVFGRVVDTLLGASRSAAGNR